MIMYTENPINLTKKLLNLISEVGKIAGYKVNIQKLKALFYSDVSERETRGGNPIYYRNKKNKIPREKLKQGGERPVLGKLQNTEERN